MTSDLFAIENVLGFIGIGFNIAWPFFRQRHWMLIAQTIACAFFVAHFYMIGAHTGAWMTGIAGLQAIAAIPLEKHKGFKVIYIATLPVIVALVILTWQGAASVCAGIAMGLISFGRYQIDMVRFRFYQMVSFAFWIAHNLITGSIPGLGSDFLTFASSLWNYRREVRSRIQTKLPDT